MIRKSTISVLSTCILFSKRYPGKGRAPMGSLIVSRSFVYLFAACFGLLASFSATGQTTQTVTITTPGANSWTVPAGVTRITVEVWGGGGGGGNSDNTTNDGGGGGGGGAYSIKVFNGSLPASFNYFVGPGGAGAPASSGTDAIGGQDTWFGNATTLMAKGGSRGRSSNDGATGGNGGSAASSIGDNSFSGGDGADGGDTGGAGGGSAGTGANGNDASGNGATSAVTGGGAGGNGGSTGNPGGAGGAPGGGGGGSNDIAAEAGGNGADGQIVITYVVPEAFTVGSVTVTGGTVVAGRWNSTNTGLNVQVPIDNDATLTGGSVQLQARISSGSFANVGSAAALAGGDLGTTKTIALTAAQFEGIASFADGETIQITAVITNSQGNSTTGTTSASTFLVDQASPVAFTVGTVTPTGGTVVIGHWNASNTGVDIQVPIANDASLNGGSLQLQGRISSGSFANLGSAVALAGGDINGTKTISLTAAQFEGIAGFAEGVTLQVTALLTDVSGNPATTGTQSATNTVVDQVAPAAFATGTVVTTGGNVIANIWNNSNTGISVSVPVANDATLNGGSIQLQARISSGSFANIGSAVTLAGGDLNTTKTVTATKAQLEAIAGFANGETIEIRAIIFDVAGNSITGTTSASTLVVNQTAPAAFTVGTITPTGGTIVSARWNASNTGVDIQVPIANDASLDGGSLQLQARIASGSFASFGAATPLITTDVNSTKTLSFTAAQFEAIAGFANGETVQVTAILTDVTGNVTTGTQSATNILVDQAAPAAFTVGTLTATGGTVAAGYWNSTNTGLNINIPIANDASLDGGTVQLQAKIVSGTYANLGSAVVLATGDVNNTKVVGITATQFESITGFANGEGILVIAILTDNAGNATTGNVSTTTIVVDQAAPAAFTAGSVVTTGGTIVAGRWNASNTGITVEVPIANDASLDGGAVQLQGRTTSGSFVNVGIDVSLGAVDLNSTKTINISDSQFEGISGFANGQTIEITAVLTDAAGNATTGATSATTIAVDEAAPAAFTVGTVTPTGGVVKAGRWNTSNTGINIQVPVANDASLNGGSIQLRGRTTSGSFANLGSAVALAGGDVNTTKTISLTDAQFESIAGFADGQTIEITAILTDVAGNATTGTTSASTIVIDQTAPAAFTVGTATVTGGTVLAGIWNNTNTGISIQVPVANDATLDGGVIQIQARITSGSFANVGSATAIAIGDLNTTKTIAITASQFEAIAGFADGETVEITAIISDVAGNAATGTTSASTIAVDQSAPTAFTVGTVTPTGGNVVAGYWNASNTGVNIQVPIANDASLNGGTLQLQGRISSGSFADLGSTIVLGGGDLNTTKTISLTDMQFEGIAGFANGVTIQITAILTDNVGNSTTGTQSATNTVVDQTLPAAFTVGAVTTVGGRVIANYWNSTNTDVSVVVPIANDVTLNGGSVQLQARISTGSFANVGSASAIAAVNVNKTVSLTAAQFEAIASFAEETDIQIRAVITDVAGNATTGTQSTTVLHVDQTAPSIASAVKIYSNKGGGPQNGGSTNNHEVIQFTLSEDITLSHGTAPKFSSTYGNQGFSVDDNDIGSTFYANNGSPNTIDGTSFSNTRLIYLESNDNSSGWSVSNATNVQYVPSGVAGTGNLIIDLAGNEMAQDIKPVTNGDAIKPFISPDVMTLYPRAGNPEKIVFTMSEELGLASGAAVTGFSTSTGTIASAVYTDNAGGAPYTITLTSTANGNWTSSTTVTYTTGGNVKDVATNEMNTVTAHALTVETDAPVISSVSIPNAPMKVGDVVTVTITTTNDDGDDPLIVAGSTIGGFPLTFTNAAGTSKTATFTVAEDGTDVAAGSNIPVTLTLQDGQGNTSTTYTTAIAQGNDRIDANAPTVVSITRATTVNSFSTTGGTTATSVVYRVTFSEDIDPTSIDAGDFIFTPATSIGGTPTIQTPVAFSGTSVYDVTVTGYTGTGRIELMFKDSQNAAAVKDLAGNSVITSASNTDGSVTGPLYTIVLPEPTANAFNLSVTVSDPSASTTTIQLNWQNPVGPTQAATDYLIRVKGPDINDAPGSYAPVADGVVLTDDGDFYDDDFTDGNGSLYVSGGTTTVTFNTLLSGKTYDFEIIPLTVAVSLDNIDYLLAGNPTIQGTTPAAEEGTITAGSTAPPSTISSLSTSFTDKNFTFRLRDDGALLGADNAKTRFGTLTIFAGSGNGVTNWADVIAEAELKDITEGTTVTTTVIGTNTITFTLPTTDDAAGELDDNEQKEYELRIRLKGPMDNAAGNNIDNDAFVFNVNAGSFASYVAGSSKIKSTQTLSTTTAVNKIDVIATQLDFTVPPPGSAFVLANLTTQPVVRARDIYGNTDANYGATLTVSNADNLPIFDAAVTPPASAGSTTTVAMTNGIATFPVNFRYGQSGNGTLSVDDGNPATDADGNPLTPDATSTAVSVAYSNTVTITDGPNGESPQISSLLTGQYNIMAFDFVVQEDAIDGAPTLISEIKITKKLIGNDVTDWSEVIAAGAILYDGTAPYPVGTITADAITFSGLSSSGASGTAAGFGRINPGASKTYRLYVWFKTTLGGSQPANIDKQNMVFEVLEDNIVLASSSSNFVNGANSNSNAAGIRNVVDVDASKLRFVPGADPAPSLLVNKDISLQPPVPQVEAVDMYNNRDKDFNSATVTVTNMATTPAVPLGMSNLPGNTSFVNGLLTFPNAFQFTSIGLGAKLNVAATGPFTVTDAQSASFDVNVAASGTITAGADAEPATISSLTTTAPGTQVFDFTITDDDGSEDDGNPTQLNLMYITYSAADNIAIQTPTSLGFDWRDAIGGATLTDGVNTIPVTTINSTYLTFDLSSVTGQALGLIGDDASKTFKLNIWLKSPITNGLNAVIDGRLFAFEVQKNNIQTDPNGSSLAVGEIENSGAGTEVIVNATQLDFTTLLPGPVSASLNTPFSQAIKVEARDARGNRDLNFTGDITAFSNTGAGSPSPVQLTMSNFPDPANAANVFAGGVFTFDPAFQFTADGGGEAGAGTLHMTAGGISGNSPSITVLSSFESQIKEDPTFVYTDNIPYINYQATDIDASDITDGDGSFELTRILLSDGDADGIPGDIDGAVTNLMSLTLGVTNHSNIRKIALYNGSGAGATEIAELDGSNFNASGEITFNGLNINAPDENNPAPTPISIRVSFKNSSAAVTDNSLIQVSIKSAIAGNGSQFRNNVGDIAGVSGGFSAPANKNFVEVVATQLNFTTQPGALAGINQPITEPVVEARDVHQVVDLDVTGLFPTISAPAGTNAAMLSPLPEFQNGILKFDAVGQDLQYVNAGSGVLTISGVSTVAADGSVVSVPNGVSSAVNVRHLQAVKVNDIDNSKGIAVETEMLSGRQSAIILGITFSASHTSPTGPILNSFTVNFSDDDPMTDNPDGDPMTPNPDMDQILENIRVWQSTNDDAWTASDQNVTSNFTMTTSGDNITFDLISDRNFASTTTTVTYFIMVDVKTSVNISTPRIRPNLRRLSYTGGTEGNIILGSGALTDGSSFANIEGRTYLFTDKAPPKIVAGGRTPANGALNHPVSGVGSDISITFDEPVFSLTDQIKVFRFDDASDLGITLPLQVGTVEPTNTLIFPTLGLLASDQRYYIQLDGIVDTSTPANAFAGFTSVPLYFTPDNTNWVFKTADTDGPKIIGNTVEFRDINLLGGNLKVALDEPGTVYYMIVNELDPAITQANIIDPSTYSGEVIAGSAEIAQADQQNFVNINTSLTDGEDYVIYVTAVDPGGNKMGTPSGSVFVFDEFDGDDPAPTHGNLIVSAPVDYQICVGDFQPLSHPITIAESANNNFSNGSFNLLLPAGFAFFTPSINQDVPGIVSVSGSGSIAATAQFKAENILQIKLTGVSGSQREAITISGLQVKANANATSGPIFRLGGSALADTDIPDLDATKNFGTLQRYNVSPVDFTVTVDNAVKTSLPDYKKDVDGDPISYTALLVSEEKENGTNIFSGDGVVGYTFIPSFAGIGTHDIKLTYLNEYNCQSDNVLTVKVFDYSRGIDGLATQYCTYRNVQTNIPIQGKSGYLLQGIIVEKNADDTDNKFDASFDVTQSLEILDPTFTNVVFKPYVFDTPEHRALFFTDQNVAYSEGGRLGSVKVIGTYLNLLTFGYEPFEQVIDIYIPPTATLSFREVGPLSGSPERYCEDQLVNLEGSPRVSPNSFGEFTINGFRGINKDPITGYTGLTDIGDGTGIINSQDVTQASRFDALTVKYSFEITATGCKHEAESLINFTPKPTADFSVTTAALCEDTPIDFNGVVSIYTGSSGQFGIQTRLWNFDDLNSGSDNESNVEDPTHTFEDPANYDVRFKVVSKDGCESAPHAAKNLIVGGMPVVNFTFTGVHNEQPIRFDASASSVNGNSTISTLEWNFGEGATYTSTNKNEDVQKDYVAPGVRQVQLRVKSAIGCESTLTRTVAVVPFFKPVDGTDYFSGFDNNGNGWQTLSLTSDPTATSWSATNGTWTTGATGSYKPEERSALYSAALDLSVLSRPILSFTNTAEFASSDGVVLEYSTDNKNVADPSKVWETLGTLTKGVVSGANWYNGVNLASQPGDQETGDLGWTGILTERESKHSLSDVKGQSNVVFRFALASALKTFPDKDGFTVDNFRIGNGTRTVLIENFTNTGSTDAAVKAENDSLKNFDAGEIGVELIKVNYHVGFPGQDPFNMQNQADPGARALYYGISTVNQVRLDGVSYGTQAAPRFSQWGSGAFSTRVLDLANARIEVTAEVIDGELTISGTFTPSITITDPAILHVAVVEELVNLNDNPELNSGRIRSGESEFEYVMRKMLPNAAGTKFTNALQAGTAVPFGPFTWSNATLFKPQDDLAIVVFLQDENSKVVYQSHIERNVNDPGIVTSTAEDLNASFNVYPNPADKEMTVELPETATQRATLRMYDQLGKVVEESYFEKGDSKKTIGTESFAGGVYVIQIETPKGVLRRKVMVTHRN